MSDLSALSDSELMQLYRGETGATPGGPLRITVTPKEARPEPNPLASMSDDQLRAAYAASAGPGYGEDMLKSAGTGLVRGATALAGLPGDVISGMGSGAEAAIGFLGENLGLPQEWAQQVKDLARTTKGIANRQYPTSDTLRRGVETVTGPLYEPQTRPGRYVETAAEFLPGALIGPGGMVRNAARFAVAPGIASEAAGELTKGTAMEPWARGGAAVVTGGASAMLTRPRTAEQALRRQIPDNIDPAIFDRAQGLVEEAASRGIRLTFPEAIEQVSPGAGTGLLNAMRVVETAPSTRSQVAPAFAERPAQFERAARTELDAIAPRPSAPSTIGPAASDAAESTINEIRAAINRATRPMYDAAGQTLVPQRVHAAMIADPLFSQALNEVRNNPAKNSFVRAQSDRSISVYDAVAKELQERARNAAAPTNPYASQAVASATGTLGTDLKDIAIAADRAATSGPSSYEAALQAQAALREKYLNPILQGPLGKIAEKDTTTRKAIEALFPRDPLVGSEDEIAAAVSALAKRNPAATRQLIRAYVESVFDESARNLQSGANQFGAANFAKVLTGNAQQRINLREAIRAMGPDGDKVWTGFKKFIEIAGASGKRQRPGSLTAFNAQELRDMSQGRLATEGAKIGVAPQRLLTKLGEAWDRWQLGKNLDELAGLLTDQRSTAALKMIAARPTGSREAQIVAGRLLGVLQQVWANKGDGSKRQGDEKRRE